MIATALITLFAALPSTGYQLLTVTNPSSALTDFTLIVDLSDMDASWWSAVDTSDGTKGRAAIHSSGTELACDWIDFDNTGETGLLRVLWDGTLATSGTQQLRVYPPVSSNDSVAADDTYGSDNAYDDNWAGYWPSGGGTDRTVNSNDLTSYGGVSVGAVAGHLGDATYYDGSDDRSEVASAVASGEPMTMMTWFSAPDVTGFHRLIEIDDDTSTSSDKDIFGIQAAGTVAGDPIQVFLYRGFTSWPASAGTYSADTWSFAAGVFASDTSRTAYFNTSTGNSTDSVSVGTVSMTRLGALYFGGTIYYSAQTLQHTSIHSAARSAAWMAMEYAQVNSNSAFYTASSWVDGGSSVPIILNHYMRRR